MSNLLNLMKNTKKLKSFVKLVQKFGSRRFGAIKQEYGLPDIYNFNIPPLSRCTRSEGGKLTCQNSAPVIDKPSEYTYLAFGLTIGITVL